MVSPAKQIFKDFSSGKGGSVVTFLMELEHFTYPEALRWLAKRYNIEIEEDKDQTPEQELAANAREAVFIITDFAKRWFEDQLQTEEGRSIGVSYFKERGFTEQTIADFGLGYAPKQRDAFAQHALAKSYSPEVLAESGISIKREDGTWYDRFWGRVIFPIYSVSGRVLGFGGRILQPDAKAAKYLNSPETPIYHKSDVLFGLFQARKAIVKEDEAFLVEGYTDVISLHQIGVQQTVASSGTALTEAQIRLLKRYTNNITILFDGDAAGIRASFRGIDMFLAEGVNVRVVLFPDGEDPDSFARKSSGIEFKEFVTENRTDFIRFKAGLLMKDAEGDPIRKAEVIRDIVNSIAKIPDEISRDVYVKESARILDMDVKVLYAELNQISAKNIREAAKKGAAPRMEVVATAPIISPVSAAEDSMHYEQEKEIIRLLINYGNTAIEETAAENEDPQEPITVAQMCYVELVPDGLQFKNTQFSQIFEMCMHEVLQNQYVHDINWYVRNPDQDYVRVIADIEFKYTLSSGYQERNIIFKRPEDLVEKHLRQALLRFKQIKVDDRLKEISETIKTTEDDTARLVLMQEHVALNAKNKTLKAMLNRSV